MMKFETALLLSIGSGDAEKEWPLLVKYRYIPADNGIVRGERINPPEAEGVEIGSVYAVTDEINHRRFGVLPAQHCRLPEWMVEPLTEQLERLCLDHYRGERDDTLERRTESRRDDAMLDRVPAHVTRAAE